MTKDNLEEIRQVHITTILGVQQKGRRVVIRCPIHNEKSGSMVIYPDGSYYCFGCQAHGSNAIDFLMAMGASFVEAVEEIKKYL